MSQDYGQSSLGCRAHSIVLLKDARGVTETGFLGLVPVPHLRTSVQGLGAPRDGGNPEQFTMSWRSF